MANITNFLYNFITEDNAPRQIFFYTTPIVSFTMKFLHSNVYDMSGALGDLSAKKIQAFNQYKKHYKSYIQTGIKIQLLIATISFFLISVNPAASFFATLFLANAAATYLTSKFYVSWIYKGSLRTSFEL